MGTSMWDAAPYGAGPEAMTRVPLGHHESILCSGFEPYVNIRAVTLPEE